MRISAAGYVRVSTDEQADQGISIPAQKARITAYCQAQGWDLFDFYIDDGFSGKNIKRPAMQQLIVDAKDRKFNTVVVIKLDRLSRRQKDVLYLLEDIFETNKIGFKSVSEAFDTTTPFGKAAIGMMAVFAQLERETIIERVKDAKKEAAKQGRFMGGPIPFGYKYIPTTKKLDIEVLEAHTVRFIFDEYLTSGKGYQYIADCLNERGIKPPGLSQEWNRSTIRAMLHNSFYAGFIEHQGKLHQGKHEALISETVFFDVQNLQNIRSTYNPVSKSGCGLLSGLLYCAECKARMRLKKVWRNPRNHKEKVAYYVCYSQDGSSRSMIKDVNCKCGYKRAADLENVVIERLMQYRHNSKILSEIAAKFQACYNSASINKTKLQVQKELDGIKHKLDKWYDAFEREMIGADDFVNRVKNLHERRSHLESQIVQYEQELSDAADKAVSVEDVITNIKKFDNIWSNSTDEEKRSILTGLIKEIYVSKDDLCDIIFV